MRHVLGVLGVLAAGVLLAVSATMNWKFGFSLGRSEVDGQIYGAASAAADCFKALVPFFFFAAIRNKMWSQAAASAVVWVIVTAYSFTSCLGHAALNRLETAGGRQVEAQTYQDHRADLKRAQDQLSWIPQHRPSLTVQSDIANARNQKAWGYTNGCTSVTGKQGREFCKTYHALNAEYAASVEAAALQLRIAEIQGKLAGATGASAMASADPQAAVLAKLTSFDVEKIQTAMTIFIALLLEIGSGFGMYIAFSQWRVYDAYGARPARKAEAAVASESVTPVTVASQAQATPLLSAPQAQPAERPAETEETGKEAAVASIEVAAPVQAEAETPKEVKQPAAEQAIEEKKIAAVIRPPVGANDNKVVSLTTKKPIVPESDVQRYYRERTETTTGPGLPKKIVLRDYNAWCKHLGKTPLSPALFWRELKELGGMLDGSSHVRVALRAPLEKPADTPAARRAVA